MSGQIQCGPFSLVSPIGEGSTGVVWRALHRGTQLPVAVKLFDKAKARSAFSLRNEVRAAARLDHENIVMLFDQGLLRASEGQDQENRPPADTAYVAMELCTGGALSEETQRVPWDVLRGRLEAMLHALAHAHSRGVIHRDLKPSNVLLTPNAEGRLCIKLSDFGIAHALVDTSNEEDEQVDPRQGRLSGTLQYMAPEQLAGQWRDEGPWTDLYALGVMTYEATSGVSPWRATTRAKLLQNMVQTTPPLRSRMPVPDGLQEWVDRLLAKQRNQRYQSAAAALAGLQALGAPTIWGHREPPPPNDQAVVPPMPPRPVPGRELALQGIGLSLYGLRPTQIAGRDEQREQSWRDLTAGIGGEGPRLLLLRGDMGVGTSKLANWLSEHAHARHGAIRLRASHSPIAGPSDGLAAMLRRQLHANGLDTGARERQSAKLIADYPLPDDSSIEATSLAALLAPAASDTSHTLVMAEQDRTVRRYLRRVSKRQPVVLTLDNAQWAHNALALCSTILDSESDALPLVILILVDDEALVEDSPEARDLEALANHPRARTLELGPLSEAEHRQLITNVIGLVPALVDKVASASGGNALYSASLLRYWVQADLLVATDKGFELKPADAEHIPDSLFAVWDAQLAVLAEQVQDIEAEPLKVALEIAAALGKSVQDNEWRAACAQAGISVPDGLVQGLAELNIVRLARLGWHFRHGTFRDHLQAQAVEAGRWQSHHSRCAEALSRMAARAPLQSPARTDGRIGQHLLRGGQYAQACRPLLRGAIAARDVSDWSESHRIFDLLAEAVEAQGDARLAVEARIERVPCYLSQGRVTLAEELAQAAIAEATGLGDGELLARANIALAAIEFAHSEPGKASALLETALEQMGPGETLWRVQALTKLGSLCMWQRRLVDASRYYRLAQEIVGDDTAYRSEQGQTLRGMAHLAHCHGDFAGATRLMSQARTCFESEGNRFATASCINDLGDLFRHQGQLIQSEKLYRDALALFESVQAADVTTAQCNLGYVLVERGQHREAESIFRGLIASDLTDERRIDMLWILCGLLACVAANKNWGEWDSLQQQITALAEKGLVDEDLAGASRLAAGLARKAGHYQRARWAYGFALEHYERMEKPKEAQTVRSLLADLG